MLLHARIYTSKQQPDLKVLPAMARTPSVLMGADKEVAPSPTAIARAPSSLQAVAAVWHGISVRAVAGQAFNDGPPRVIIAHGAQFRRPATSNGAAQRKSVVCAACFTVAWW